MKKNTRLGKYLGKEFDGWKVTYRGIAYIQSAKSIRAYHKNYYYLLETTDTYCIKQVRLNSTNMCQVARGELDINHFATTRGINKATNRLTYAYIK